ncbi:MAG: hypothetical protein RIS75_1367 [Actinomycetota bacterium]|jgi:DNA polymerase-3 subunit gamma/tau
MSLALYRTYRPGTFAEVIGQEHVTTPLMRALEADRTHHAYLFSGPRGCGKTSSARILARSLNCAQGPTAIPCGVCQSCVELAPNGPGSLDVVELDAASNRGIDQARELRDRAMYAPASSRFRIYIIDEAHQLTTEAANALLKLVEEPPEHLRFVFATTEPEKLLGTIRSRTHHYPFRLVPTNVLQEHLVKVCAAESVPADPAALALAAKAGAGSVRDALSVLGQLVGGAGDAGITYDDAVTQLGFTADTMLDTMLGALAASDGSAVFKVLDQVVTSGHDPRRFATDLLERLRDLIVLTAAPDAAEHGLIAQPADRLEVLRAQAQSLGIAALSRAADLVSDGLTALRGATAPRLHLELLAARLLVTASDADTTSMLTRLDAIERTLANGVPVSSAAPTVDTPAAPKRATPPPALSEVAPSTAPAAPATPVAAVVTPVEAAVEVEPQEPASVIEPAAEVAAPVEPAAPAVPETPTTPAAPAPAATNPSDQVDLAAIVSLWPAVVEAVRTLPQGGRIAWVSASGAIPTSATASTLTLSFNNLGPMNMAKSRNFDAVFAAAAASVLGRNFQIEMVHDPAVVLPSTADLKPADMSPRPVAAASAPAPAEPQTVVEQPREVPPPQVDAADDIPADDDPVTTSASGVELVADLLGGVIIDEYDEKSRK